MSLGSTVPGAARGEPAWLVHTVGQADVRAGIIGKRAGLCLGLVGQDLPGKSHGCCKPIFSTSSQRLSAQY